MFKLQDNVLLGREKGVVVGKRYGDALDTFAGRFYDVQIERGTWRTVRKDVEERNLVKFVEETPAFTSAPIRIVGGTPVLVK